MVRLTGCARVDAFGQPAVHDWHSARKAHRSRGHRFRLSEQGAPAGKRAPSMQKRLRRGFLRLESRR
jgi:hypothetical protein